MKKWIFLVLLIIGLVIAVDSQAADDNGKELIFNCGRAYQMGRTDAILGMAMRSRGERENPGQIWAEIGKDPISREVLHRCYEDGYLEYIREKGSKLPITLPKRKL
jgi:hypothetical protein